MSDESSQIEAIYTGWCNYQSLLIASIEPLTPDQLSLQASPNLRSIEEIATHMIGARGRWFNPPLGDGDEKLAAYSQWDSPGGVLRNASEIVTGLQFTLEYIHSTVARWTPADWQSNLPGEGPYDPSFDTRQWVIWHLIEHDLHHGGEISLTMGMYKLKAPEL